jgi:hypothetical protein
MALIGPPIGRAVGPCYASGHLMVLQTRRAHQAPNPHVELRSSSASPSNPRGGVVDWRSRKFKYLIEMNYNELHEALGMDEVKRQNRVRV